MTTWNVILKKLHVNTHKYNMLNRYDKHIQTFFNPQAIPGSYIFVEPKGFDPTIEIDEDLTKYGIGGYLMVIQANNSIS